MPLYEEARRTIAMHLGHVPAQYRSQARRWIRHKTTTCRPTTLRNYANYIRSLHDFLGQDDPATVGAERLRSFAIHATETMAVSTAYYTCMNVKPYISFLRGERISDDEADALTTRPPDDMPDAKHLVYDHEWNAILDQCHTFHRRFSSIRHLRSYAALMTLRWCGMRMTEMCALNVGSVDFDDQGARLVIPNHAEGLKTGSRAVYVIEPANALKAWLAVHPDARADSPLFTALGSIKGRLRLDPNNFATHLKLLAERSGVNAGRLKPVTPHDLRHTRATELAKANISEAKLRRFFGWAPGSSMPSHYVYLAHGDLRDDLLALAKERPTDTRECPYCAEPIKATAIKCRHCHSNLDAVVKPAGRASV